MTVIVGSALDPELAAIAVPAAVANTFPVYTVAAPPTVVNKPVSPVAQTFLALTTTALMLSNIGGAPLASPIFTGVPKAPTPTNAGDNTTQIPTTAWVNAAITNATTGLYLSLAGGTLTGNLSIDTTPALSAPTLTFRSAPTVVSQIAFYQDALARWIIRKNVTAEGANDVGSNLEFRAYDDAGAFKSAPMTLFRSDGTPGSTGYASFANPPHIGVAPDATATNNQVPTTQWVKNITGLLAPISSPTFTGTPDAPTPAATDNSTRIATTQFVGKATRRVYNVHLRQPSCPTDGVTDAQPFIQLVINEAIAAGGAFAIELNAYKYLLNNELDFGAAVSSTQSFEFYGMGPKRTVLQVGANFGSGRALLRIDMNSPGHLNVSSITLRDFDIVGTGENSPTDPIAIFFPTPWRGKIWRVNCSSLGNTVAYIPNAFNADINYCSWTACGRQTLEKNVSDTVKVSVTAGSKRVTATEGIFTSPDASSTTPRVVFIEDAVDSDIVLTSEVESFIDSTHIDLKTAASHTVSDASISYDCLRGWITSGSKTLTVNNSSGLVSQDVGRFIYIMRAGTDGEVLCSKVTAVSGTAITLLDTAKTTVSSSAPQDVYLGPTIVSAAQQSDIDTADATGHSYLTNDLTLNGMQIEQYHGPSILTSHALGIYMNQTKCEGEPESTQNNFATSRQCIVQSKTTRMYMQGLMLIHTWVGPNTGLIRQSGNAACSLKIDDLIVSGVAVGASLVHQDDAEHVLVVGDVLSSSHNWMAAPMSTYTGRDTVFLSGAAISTTDDFKTSPKNLITPYFAGSFRSTYPDSIADNEIYSFKPPADYGIIDFWSSSTTVRGRYTFRVSTSNFMEPLDTPASAMVHTLGVLTSPPDGKFTVSATNDGRIYIANKIGNSLKIMWHVLA